MTLPELLSEIKARAEAATPGPWWIDELNSSEAIIRNETAKRTQALARIPNYKWLDSLDATEKIAEFIAHARTDIPRLVEALEKAIEQRNEIHPHPRDSALEDYDAKLTAILRGEREGK